MRTFSWFLYTFGDLASHAFNSAYIKAGWALVGLSPLSPQKMMDSWAFLPDLIKFSGPSGVEDILRLVPDCAKVVSETGALLDDDMDRLFYNDGGLFSRVPNSQNEAKDTSEQAPVNHR